VDAGGIPVAEHPFAGGAGQAGGSARPGLYRSIPGSPGTGRRRGVARAAS